MGYSKHAFRGSSLNSAVKILTILATGAKIYVLARLLSKYDFGLFQYVIIAIGLLDAVTQTGINTTIIQANKSIHYFLDTAWVISILRGFLNSILIILVGFWMQGFFHEQQLVILMAVASFVPLIKGFINPAIVTLYQDLDFGRDSVYQFSLVAVDAIVSIFLGLFFHSVFVLVFAMIASAVFEVGISFYFFTAHPRFHAIKSRVIEIFGNAKSLNLMTILSYLVENIDNLLVGKVAGTAALGVYSNAYSLSHRLNLQFAKSVQYGTFPIYVKIAEERPRLKRAFWKASIFSLGALFAISLPFLLFPGLAVTIILGDKWLEVIPTLRPLIFAGMIQSFITLTAALFTATKHYAWLNSSLFINTVGLLILVPILGMHYGLMGCVYGVLISRAIVIPFSLLGVWTVLREKREGRLHA